MGPHGTASNISHELAYPTYSRTQLHTFLSPLRTSKTLRIQPTFTLQPFYTSLYNPSVKVNNFYLAAKSSKSYHHDRNHKSRNKKKITRAVSTVCTPPGANSSIFSIFFLTTYRELVRSSISPATLPQAASPPGGRAAAELKLIRSLPSLEGTKNMSSSPRRSEVRKMHQSPGEDTLQDPCRPSCRTTKPLLMASSMPTIPHPSSLTLTLTLILGLV